MISTFLWPGFGKIGSGQRSEEGDSLLVVFSMAGGHSTGQEENQQGREVHWLQEFSQRHDVIKHKVDVILETDETSS